MLLLSLAVLLAAAPLDRAGVFALMEQQPTPGCATGNPWLGFVHAAHDPVTNQLLMQLATEATLDAPRRGYALVALREQTQPEVLAFFRARFAAEPGGTGPHRVAALALVEHGTSEDLERVAGELGSDSELDHGFMIVLMQESRGRKPTAKTLAAAHALWEGTKDASLKADAGRWLAKVDPASGVASAALRSKDPRQIDQVVASLESKSVVPADLIEALALANPYGRDRLEHLLAQHLHGQLTGRPSATALAEALATEWLSAQPRPGLLRAPTVAFVLGTWQESAGKLDRARALYEAGEAAVAKLPTDDDSEELAGVALAFRAQRAALALKQHRISDAKTLTRGMREALLKYREAGSVLQNYTVGYEVSISNTAWELEAKVSKMR